MVCGLIRMSLTTKGGETYRAKYKKRDIMVLEVIGRGYYGILPIKSRS